ncbi:MAG: hypothetical protein ABI758_05260 [Candidatus Woesebacteria bacterium]
MSTVEYAAKHHKLGLCRSCPRPLVEGSGVYCKSHRDINRIRGRVKDKRLSAKLKQKCFQYYGAKCHCCGEETIQFLTLEHELGNGNNHRKALFKHNVGGAHMYRWLKKNNFPKGFSILCMNCNWAKRYGGICPHKLGEVA